MVPDQISHRLQQLHLTGKIKDRSRAIFGTGDSLRVITITANSGNGYKDFCEILE